jgi:hypothetical protein
MCLWKKSLSLVERLYLVMARGYHLAKRRINIKQCHHVFAPSSILPPNILAIFTLPIVSKSAGTRIWPDKKPSRCLGANVGAFGLVILSSGLSGFLAGLTGFDRCVGDS